MINKTILPNGLKIITEHMPLAYSSTVMVWINVGPEAETVKNNGISHLIEHMLFKGTAKRTAKEIVQSIENTGGSINAFTQKEQTCCYAKVLSEHVPLVTDILLDMVFNSIFSQEDIELEKRVISSEIKMYEDTPDELVYDVALKSFLNGHPLGNPIAGTSKSIRSISRDDIIEFIKKYYAPNNIVISIAGNFNEKQLIDQITELAGNKTSEIIKKKENSISFCPELNTYNKEIEQVHMCFITKGVSILDSKRHTLSIIDCCLGDGMGSRLFQNIREKKGLVYSIDTFEASFREFGIFGVYAGTNLNSIEEVIDLIFYELDSIAAQGLSTDEISRVKTQIKGSLLIGLDSTKRRAVKNARSEIYFNEIHTIEEICAEIDNVSYEDIKELGSAMFKRENFGITVVGPQKFMSKKLIKV
jgi:predicted Zn-dependent peptidase